MLADIATGNTNLADWLLLAAFIVFVVDAVLALVSGLSSSPIAPAPIPRLRLVSIGLALVAFALLQW